MIESTQFKIEDNEKNILRLTEKYEKELEEKLDKIKVTWVVLFWKQMEEEIRIIKNKSKRLTINLSKFMVIKK